jgi:sulfate adenylyltransferase large subunit
MSKRESMKIVIVGHVDHGKSSLIGRLLYDTGSLPPDRMELVRKTCEEMGKKVEFAFVMDHLKEEREKGITIDTAQTFFRTPTRDYVIIDAPGHKEFIKNMITGASQAETSLLVIDAQEGIMEQTRRHAYILGMLNLKKNIIVINKMDLVGYDEKRFNDIKNEVTSFLAKLRISPSFVVPACATEGVNFAEKSEKLGWYAGPTLFGALDALEKDKDISEKPLRLPVQDVYSTDEGEIIVGRVESGMLDGGMELMLLPAKRTVRVARLLEFGKDSRNAAEAGESIGLTLDGNGKVKRGEVLSAADQLPRVSGTIEANLFWMSAEPLDKNEEITFRANTQAVSCKVKEIRRRIDSSSLDVLEEDAGEIRDNEVGEVVLQLDHPVTFELFSFIPELGRFVMERGNDIVAGGIVTHG